jgi:hypothetical protein
MLINIYISTHKYITYIDIANALKLTNNITVTLLQQIENNNQTYTDNQ